MTETLNSIIINGRVRIGDLGVFNAWMENAHRQTQTASVKVSEEPIMAWNVHLLKQEPKKLGLVLPVFALSMLACYILHSTLFMVVLVFLFVSALAEYLFPIRYKISEQGAEARTLFSRNFIEWERVRKYYLDDHGIKLSTLPKPGRLEAYRGLYLRFGENEKKVVEVVRRMRDAKYSTK